MALSNWLPSGHAAPWVPAPVSGLVASRVPDGGMGMHEGGDTVGRDLPGAVTPAPTWRRENQGDRPKGRRVRPQRGYGSPGAGTSGGVRGG